MAQFDVYLNPGTDTRDAIPYLLDVQADLLDGLATRVVVPLISAAEMPVAARHLNPQFRIGEVAVVMSTAELAGVSVRSLGEKVASLKDRRDEIVAALDLLFTGI
ncbi:MAG: CcdB family protein [Burkholderiales bacterium]